MVDGLALWFFVVLRGSAVGPLSWCIRSRLTGFRNELLTIHHDYSLDKNCELEYDLGMVELNTSDSSSYAVNRQPLQPSESALSSLFSQKPPVFASALSQLPISLLSLTYCEVFS